MVAFSMNHKKILVEYNSSKRIVKFLSQQCDVKEVRNEIIIVFEMERKGFMKVFEMERKGFIIQMKQEEWGGEFVNLRIST